MNPLIFPRVNARIADGFLIIGSQNSLLIDSLEMMFVVRRPISDDNLTRILVWHYNACNWQTTAIWVGIVRGQLLLEHASVLSHSELIGCVAHWLHLRWLVQVLVACWVLPTCFLERILNGYGFPIAAIFLLNISASTNFGVSEIHGRLVKFDWLEKLWVMYVSRVLWLIILQSFILSCANCSWFWSRCFAHFFKI